jgi:hypothetical protein
MQLGQKTMDVMDHLLFFFFSLSLSLSLDDKPLASLTDHDDENFGKMVDQKYTDFVGSKKNKIIIIIIQLRESALLKLS